MKMMTGGDKSIILKYDRCIFYSCILLLWTGVTKFTVITVVPFTSPDLQLILQFFICLSVHVNGNYRHLFPFCLEMYSLSFFEGLNIVWMQLKAWRSVWSEIESLKNKNIKKRGLTVGKKENWASSSRRSNLHFTLMAFSHCSISSRHSRGHHNPTAKRKPLNS